MSYGDPGFRSEDSSNISARNQSQENLRLLGVEGKVSNSYIQDPELAELYSRLRSQEDEILQLHKRVADASNKEQELLNEKHVLERKLSELRMALDEKHINALTDAFKDLTTRKAYVEENLKVANELKITEDEKYTFTSALLILLAEYDIRPSLIDASSISSNVKRLYNQMQWRIRASNGTNAYTVNDYSQHPHDMHVESPSYQPANNEFQFFHSGTEPRDVEGRAMRHQSNASYDSEGDVKPGIEGFLITGDAKPGNALKAYGYPVNGTSLCIFQWVRYYQDGTREYVEGASNPEYFITADDVDKIVAVDCIPMDDIGRQGDLVTHFANNQNKIACDPEMHQEMQKYLSTGRASFNVLLLRDSSESWEPATLILKRSSYQLKINNVETLREEYSADLSIKLPSGPSTQFVLTCSNGISYPFNTSRNVSQHITENDIWLRDIIVLTMRLFQSKALNDKRKGKV